MIAVPTAPAPQSRPTPSPRRRRNQRLTAAISGTIEMDWVIDIMTPKVMKKCHGWLMIPNSSMLTRYRAPPPIIILRAPYRSPSQPLTGAHSAATQVVDHQSAADHPDAPARTRRRDRSEGR